MLSSESLSSLSYFEELAAHAKQFLVAKVPCVACNERVDFLNAVQRAGLYDERACCGRPLVDLCGKL